MLTLQYFITKESDSKMIRTEKGDGYELKYVREVVGDVMTLVSDQGIVIYC